MLYGMRFSFSHLTYYLLCKIFLILLKINLPASEGFLGHFIFLVLVFQKFLEPNRWFKLKIDPMYMMVLSVPINHRYLDSTVSSFRVYPHFLRHTRSLHRITVSTTCVTHRFPCAHVCSEWRSLWWCFWHTQKWVQSCVALYLFQALRSDDLHSPLPVLGKPGLQHVDSGALVRHVLTGQLQ